MGIAGNRQWWEAIPDGVLILIMVTGLTRTAVGTGYRITPGAGPHSTMAVGSTIIDWAGVGLRILFGGLPGFAGDTATLTAAGRRCRQLRAIERASA